MPLLLLRVGVGVLAVVLLVHTIHKLMQKQVLHLILREAFGQVGGSSFVNLGRSLGCVAQSRENHRSSFLIQSRVLRGLGRQASVFLIDFLPQSVKVNSFAVQVVADSFESSLLHIRCLSGFLEFPSPFDVFIIPQLADNVKLRVC